MPKQQQSRSTAQRPFCRCTPLECGEPLEAKAFETLGLDAKAQEFHCQQLFVASDLLELPRILRVQQASDNLGCCRPWSERTLAEFQEQPVWHRHAPVLVLRGILLGCRGGGKQSNDVLR